MWRTDSYWFDVALIATIFAFGTILFGHFEAHRPKWRGMVKVVVVIALFVGVDAAAGRGWMFALLGASALGVAVIHGWWLPRNGVNGWTAEPRERYFALLGLGPDGRPRPRAARDA
jgi:hypothetical protein